MRTSSDVKRCYDSNVVNGDKPFKKCNFQKVYSGIKP